MCFNHPVGQLTNFYFSHIRIMVSLGQGQWPSLYGIVGSHTLRPHLIGTMTNRRARHTKYGIVALAVLAILGWIREPEKHGSAGDSSVSAGERPTFSAPPSPADAIDQGKVDQSSGHAAQTGVAALERDSVSPVRRPSAAVRRQIRRGPVQSSVVKTRTEAPVDSGRHEGPELAERSVTESTQVRTERAASEPPQDRREPAVNNTPDQTQPVVRDKKRSTARSVAIIAGLAAAGAAIGGVADGGKGAAIGAITGGAGGYVYDRMTRRVDDRPPVTDRDDQISGDMSTARLYGTPSFTGR